MAFHTFSIVAADPGAGECGVAVASKFLAVGAAVPWARGGVGAIATQSHANTAYGPQGLDLLSRGVGPEEVLARLTGADPEAAVRQVGIVALRGGAATYTGAGCFPWAGGSTGPAHAAQGNLLVSAATVGALHAGFERACGPLSARLLAALREGERAGGDRRGKQSAALLVVKPGGGYGGFNDRYLDLRVDDHPDPVTELGRVYDLWRLYFEKPSEAELVVIDAALAEELRRGLHRLGYDPGDGAGWDERARAAFRAFSERENLEDRLRPDGRTDQRVLAYVRARLAAG